MQGSQELGPEGLGFRGADTQADDLAVSLDVGSYGDYRRARYDPATLTQLQIGGVQPDIGSIARQRQVQELT